MIDDDLIPPQVITLVSLVAGLICIYLSSLSFGGIFSIIATALFVILAGNTLRYIGNYSLGTGVPSIIYMLVSLSLVVLLLSMILTSYTANIYLLPIITTVLSVVFASIVSLICRHIFNIQIEILTSSYIKITMASALAILSMSTLICNSYDCHILMNDVVMSGLVLLLMFATIMVIQNPYNSSMGPNEYQIRTLYLALAETFMMLTVVSFVSMLHVSIWYVYLIISLILMIYFLHKYIKSCKLQVASIKYYGLWDEGDEGDY